MDSKLHLQDDGENAENSLFDSSLKLDTYDNGPPILSHLSSQNFLPPFPQAPNTFHGSEFLVPGYLDPMSNSFIPSPTTTVTPPMNGYLVGGSGQNNYPYQHMDASASNPIKRCAQCKSACTPMWRRGPQGPRSLCNACGIRNRKEEEKKKAQERMNQPTN